MNDGEVFAFGDTFRALERVFPKRLADHEQKQMIGDYFKILRRFSLQQAQAGAEVWMQRGKYFPKPAEWIDAIPKRQQTVDVPEMTGQKAVEYKRAEALRYEDHPCQCEACRRAEVTDKPLRFVPEFDSQDREVKLRVDDKIVTAGHWAHGNELARYYKAKGDFYEKFYQLLARK
jgi:hypothetical protein